MVFAGNNIGGAFFFLDKLKGEEGRERGRKKAQQNKLEHRSCPKCIAHLVLRRMQKYPQEPMLEQGTHKKMLLLSLGDSLFSQIC